MEVISREHDELEAEQKEITPVRVDYVEGAIVSDMAAFAVTWSAPDYLSKNKPYFKELPEYTSDPIEIKSATFPETQFNILDTIRSHSGGKWFFNKQIGESNMHSFSQLLGIGYEAATKGILGLSKAGAVRMLHIGEAPAHKMIDVRLTLKGLEYHSRLRERFPDAIEKFYGSKKITSLQQEINHARKELGRGVLEVISYKFDSLEEQVRITDQLYAKLRQLENQIDARNPRLRGAA